MGEAGPGSTKSPLPAPCRCAGSGSAAGGCVIGGCVCGIASGSFALSLQPRIKRPTNASADARFLRSIFSSPQLFNEGLRIVREISVRYLLCEAPQGRVARKRHRWLSFPDHELESKSVAKSVPANCVETAIQRNERRSRWIIAAECGHLANNRQQLRAN